MKKIIFILLITNYSLLIATAQWVVIPNGMNAQIVRSLAANVNTIFAGTEGYGVYLSYNNGTNWTQTSLGNGNNIFSLAINGNNIFAGTTTQGVYLSTNNGTTWNQTSLDNRFVYSLAVNGNYIFAGTGDSGVYRSTNNGTDWTQSSLNNRYVYSLAINGNTIFAGTGGIFQPIFVWKSPDNGNSWAPTSSINQTVYSLALNGNYIFAGTFSNGVYLSTNNGGSWTQAGLTGQTVLSLAVNGNYIFAGINTAGVYVSNDNGASWTQRNEGLGNLFVWAFCIINNYIFAGTHNRVYRRPLSELTDIKPISEQIPSHYALEQNYPNPFNPTTVIRYSLIVNSDVSLKVYDIPGQETAVLVNEKQQPGTYEVEWNASNYPSGVYYYKLTANDFTETKKMILIK